MTAQLMHQIRRMAPRATAVNTPFLVPVLCIPSYFSPRLLLAQGMAGSTSRGVTASMVLPFLVEQLAFIGHEMGPLLFPFLWSRCHTCSGTYTGHPFLAFVETRDDAIQLPGMRSFAEYMTKVDQLPPFKPRQQLHRLPTRSSSCVLRVRHVHE